MVRYRAAAAATLRIVPLDDLTLVFHRPAGATHLLAEPAPEILSALAEGEADSAGLLDRLRQRYDIADAAALGPHLEELVAAGLVERL